MTLEQIVNTHPCPIIRGKIMENVGKDGYYQTLLGVIGSGFSWNETKEGEDFWYDVSHNLTAIYSDLKHLDNSYVPETANPTVMWRKIDLNNLCTESVVAIDNDHTPKQVVKGTLELTEDERIRLYIGYGLYMYRFTHYIPLSELINLPIQP
jgi:hypothetical protein